MVDLAGLPDAPDFWRCSGDHLLTPEASGRLSVTDDFLRAYWLRPEVIPVAGSCAAEVALHDELMANPAWRCHPRAWRGSPIRTRAPATPRCCAFATGSSHGRRSRRRISTLRARARRACRLVLDQLVHVLLCHLLAGCDDPIRLRAAELLFREQNVTIQDGAIMLADEETVEMHAGGAAPGAHGLLVASEALPKSVELDVLDEHTAAIYWARSDRFDTVLDLSFQRPGLDALFRVLEAWVRRLSGAAVGIQPVPRIDDERWVWHVGLDAEASAFLNQL